MLATRTTTGSGAAVTHTACGLSARAIRRATIAFSSRSLSLCSSCSPRWSSTAGSALRPSRPGERHGARPLALAAHQQLGAGGHERRVAAADREHVAGRERLPQHAEHRAPGSWSIGRVDLDLAREHDLLELAGPDPLHRAARPPPRSAPAASGWTPSRCRPAPGSSSGSGGVRSSPSRRRARSRRSSTVSSGATSRLSVSAPGRPCAASETSGTTSDAGANPCQRGEPAAVGREREPADRDQPRSGRTGAVVGDRRLRPARASGPQPARTGRAPRPRAPAPIRSPPARSRRDRAARGRTTARPAGARPRRARSGRRPGRPAR